jgi:predicted permease
VGDADDQRLTAANGSSPPAAAAPAPADDVAAFKRLCWLAVVVRQIVCPAVCILAFHFVVRPAYPAITSPASRAIILTLFLELSAPTAIAASLLCNMHDYMPADFASGLFIQYIAAVPIATLWISFTLWYIDAYCSGA